MSRRIVFVWLLAVLLSFPVTVGIVLLSGYRWNPYMIQFVFVEACTLTIVWRVARGRLA